MGRLSSRMQPVFYDRHVNLVSRLDDGILWDAPFELLPLSTSANASELRGRLAAMGLAFTRASAATVQTSASEVVTSGIGVDDPRVGNAGYGRGLVIEEARTGMVTQSSVGAWSTTGTASYGASGVAGPDGSTGTVQSVLFPADNDGVWITGPGGVVSSTYTRQAWVKGTVGETLSIRDASGNAGTTQYVMTGNWQRITISIAQTAAGSSLFIRREVGDTATSALVWFRQIELGKFPTEAIITTGAAATRAGERLRVDSTARMVRNGTLRLELDFTPKPSTRAGFSAYPTIAIVDANNYVAFDYINGRVTASVGGVAVSIATGATLLDWTDGDRVRLFVAVGNGTSTVRFKVGSGAVATVTNSTVMGAFPSGSAVDIMNNAGATQFSAWIRRVRAYAPGRRPAWAA